MDRTITEISARPRAKPLPSGDKPMFVVSADWHLCRSAWRRSGIDGDAAYGLRQVVDLCLSLDVPLLAAGDLLDTTDPDPDDVRVVREQMDRMATAAIPVFYVQGQHELDRQRPWLSAIHTWPTYVGDPSEAHDFCGRLRIRGLDWQPAGRLQEELAKPRGDKADVLLCHQAWRDFMGGDGSRSEGAFTEVRDHLVLTGDYHRHVVATYTPLGGPSVSGTAYSPGPTHMTSIDEPERKAVFLFVKTDDMDCHFGLRAESVWLRTRPVRRFAVHDEGELVELLTHGLPLALEAAAAEAADLPDHLRRPLVRVAYAADIPGARRRLEAACRDLFHLFPKCLPTPAAVETRAAARRIVEGGLGAALAARGVPEAVRRDAGRLLRADDPERAVDELCADYLAARALDRAAETETA